MLVLLSSITNVSASTFTESDKSSVLSDETVESKSDKSNSWCYNTYAELKAAFDAGTVGRAMATLQSTYVYKDGKIYRQAYYTLVDLICVQTSSGGWKTNKVNGIYMTGLDKRYLFCSFYHAGTDSDPNAVIFKRNQQMPSWISTATVKPTYSNNYIKTWDTGVEGYLTGQYDREIEVGVPNPPKINDVDKTYKSDYVNLSMKLSAGMSESLVFYWFAPDKHYDNNVINPEPYRENYNSTDFTSRSNYTIRHTAGNTPDYITSLYYVISDSSSAPTAASIVSNGTKVSTTSFDIPYSKLIHTNNYIYVVAESYTGNVSAVKQVNLSSVNIDYNVNGGTISNNSYTLAGTGNSWIRLTSNSSKPLGKVYYDGNYTTLSNSTVGLTKQGYTFGGWVVTKNGTDYTYSANSNATYSDLSSKATDGYVNFYAKWNPSLVSYWVHDMLQKPDGTYYEEDCTDYEEYTDTELDIISDCVGSYTGYSFKEAKIGDDTGPTGGAVTTATVKADGSLHIYVYFDRGAYSYKVNTHLQNINDNNYTTTSSTYNAVYGSEVGVSSYATAPTGFTLSSIRVDNVVRNSNYVFTMPNNNNTVIDVYFNRNTYNVKVSVGEGINGATLKDTNNSTSDVSISTSYSGSYRYGETLTLGANKEVGYINPVSWKGSPKDLTGESVTHTVDSDCNWVVSAVPDPNTTYKVRHWLQKLDKAISGQTTHNSTNYENVETNSLLGTTDSTVTVSSKSFKGFTLDGKSSVSVTISGDGSTVVDFYYLRNYHKVSVLGGDPDTNGVDTRGNGVDTVSYKGKESSVSKSGNTVSVDKVYYGETITVDSVIEAGYTWKDWIGDFSSSNKNYTFTMPDKDVTVTANATANTNTPYKVRHWLQKLDKALVGKSEHNSENYDLGETENLTGTTDTLITVKAKNYVGFTIDGVSSVEVYIDGDGSTVVDYYYTRNYHKVELFGGDEDLNGEDTRGVGIDTVTYSSKESGISKTDNTIVIEKVYYGETISIDAFVESGYTWLNWVGTSKYTKQSETFSMPDNDVELEAKAEANQNTSYKVNHWQEKLEGNKDIHDADNYDLVETESFEGVTDTEVIPRVKVYKGFNSPMAVAVYINGDGSTVVDYYYTRKTFVVTNGNGGGGESGVLTAPGNGIGSIEGAGLKYKYGQEVVLKAIIKEGYHWHYEGSCTCETDTSKYPTGWVDKNALVGKPGLPAGTDTTKPTIRFSMPDNDINLLSQATNNSYRVQFSNNKPNNATNPTVGRVSELLCFYDVTGYIPSQMPTLKGWTFEGWTYTIGDVLKNEWTYLDSKWNDTKIWNLTSTFNGVCELEAKWRAHTYTVKFDSNKPNKASGAIEGGVTDVVLTYDSAEPLPNLYGADLSDVGIIINEDGSYSYTDEYNVTEGIDNSSDDAVRLTGWTPLGYMTQKEKEAGETSFRLCNVLEQWNFTDVDGGEVTLYVKWTDNKYKIVFNSVNGYGGPTEMELTYDVESTIPTTVPTRYGYEFENWENSFGIMKERYNPGSKVINLATGSANSEIVLFSAVWRKMNFTITKVGSTAYSGVLSLNSEGKLQATNLDGINSKIENGDYVQKWVITKNGTGSLGTVEKVSSK